ncbi:MAG: polyprenyl diphosphate synthase [archaeon]
MFDKLIGIKKGVSVSRKSMPRHIAVSLNGCIRWAKENKSELDASYKKGFQAVSNLISAQTSMDIPILTVHLLSEQMRTSVHYDAFAKLLARYLAELSNSELISTRQVKVSVLGKWYDLPGDVVEQIKKILDSTRDYDRFFLNLCINYDGQEEIMDGCRLILRKALSEKLDPASLDRSVIKDNLYSSYYPPPSLLVVTGGVKHTSGLLLWDSGYSHIYFSDVLWPDFSKGALLEAIASFQKK